MTKAGASPPRFFNAAFGAGSTGRLVGSFWLNMFEPWFEPLVFLICFSTKYVDNGYLEFKQTEYYAFLQQIWLMAFYKMNRKPVETQ